MASVPDLPEATNVEWLAQEIGARLPLRRTPSAENLRSIELGPSFPIWTVHESHPWLVNAGCWLHLVTEQGRVTYMAKSTLYLGSLVPPCLTPVTRVWRPPIADDFARVLARVKQRFDDDWVARVVDVPSRRLLAIWLRHEARYEQDIADDRRPDQLMRDSRVQPHQLGASAVLIVAAPQAFWQVHERNRDQDFEPAEFIRRVQLLREPVGVLSPEPAPEPAAPRTVRGLG